jgi:hypothetical protein
MKRPLACLIIAGTFTFGTSMIASAAPSVPSSVQTSQGTVQKVRDDYTVCRHGYRHTRSGRRIACGHGYTSPGVTIRLGTTGTAKDSWRRVGLPAGSISHVPIVLRRRGDVRYSLSRKCERRRGAIGGSRVGVMQGAAIAYAKEKNAM